MATTVHFTGKGGKVEHITFPARTLAESYARTVKGARLEDTEASAPVVVVQKCPVATAEVQKAATNTYYRSVKTPVNGVVLRETRTAESDAEQMMEHFADCRAAGMATEEAFADWNQSN